MKKFFAVCVGVLCGIVFSFPNAFAGEICESNSASQNCTITKSFIYLGSINMFTSTSKDEDTCIDNNLDENSPFTPFGNLEKAGKRPNHFFLILARESFPGELMITDGADKQCVRVEGCDREFRCLELQDTIGFDPNKDEILSRPIKNLLARIAGREDIDLLGKGSVAYPENKKLLISPACVKKYHISCEPVFSEADLSQKDLSYFEGDVDEAMSSKFSSVQNGLKNLTKVKDYNGVKFNCPSAIIEALKQKAYSSGLLDPLIEKLRSSGVNFEWGMPEENPKEL